MADPACENQWLLYKSRIRQLYLIEGLTLKELGVEMEARYRFRATKAQYEFKLKQWKFRKNLPQHLWETVHEEIRKRKLSGKASEVICSGVTLSSNQVEKATKRVCFSSTVEKGQCAERPGNPPEDVDIWVRTPPSHPSDCTWPDGLPWFSFQEQCIEVIAKLADPDIQDAPVMVNAAFRQVLGARRQLSAIPLRPDLQQNRSLACTVLSNIMPEKFPGENVVRSHVLCHTGRLDNIPEILELLFFLASNNLPQATSWSRELDIFVISLFRKAKLRFSALKSLAASQEPSANALIHQVFASAVRVADVEVVHECLQIGIDPNHPILLKYFDPRPQRLPSTYPFSLGHSALPLQLGFCTGNFDLIKVLMSWDVDVERVTGAFSLLDYLVFASASDAISGRDLLRSVLDQHRPTDSEWIRALGHANLCGDPRTSRELLDLWKDRIGTSKSLQQEALVAAVRSQHDDMVLDLLSSGVDPNFATRMGRYPLWEAIYVARYDLFQLLLDHGASVQSIHPDQPTPLQCAAYMGDTTAIQLLLRNGVDVNQLNSSNICKVGHTWCLRDSMIMGRTALEGALYGGQPEAANLLLGHGAELFGSELIIAIQQRLPSVVENLLSLGPSLSNVGEANETALEAAITTGQFEIAHLILANNDSIYDPGALCAAVHMAMFTGDYHIVENILACRSFSTVRDELLEGTALGIASYHGDEILFNTLLAYGISSTVSLIRNDARPMCSHESLGAGQDSLDGLIRRAGEESGWWHPGRSDWDFQVVDITTPLELAVAGNHEGLVISLINIGCEPTPACVLRASFDGSAQCLDILLGAGADINGRRFDTDTALQVAVRRQHKEAVQLLLAAGADINAVPSRTDGDLTQTFNFSYAYSARTALQAAVELGDLELMELLLDNGADINSPAGDDRGATALQLAAIQGFVGIAKTLLQRGADCNAPAAKHHGRTALQGAAEHGRIDMVQLLLNFGADIYGSSRMQYIQAVRFALKNGHSGAVRILRTMGDWSEQDEAILLSLDRRVRGNPRQAIKHDNIWQNEDIEATVKDRDDTSEQSDASSSGVGSSSTTLELSPRHAAELWKCPDSPSSSLPIDTTQSCNETTRYDPHKNEAEFVAQVVAEEDWFAMFVSFPEDS